MVGADLLAHPAAGALARIHHRGDALRRDLLPGEDDGRPGRGSLGLGHRLLQRFRIVAEPRQEDPLGGEIHRPELHVGLQEEAVGIQGALEEPGQGAGLLPGHHAVGQDQEPGPEDQGPPKDVILHLQPDPLAFELHLGRVFRLEVDEYDAGLPGLQIEGLVGSVGAYVAVEHEDGEIGPPLLQGQGLLDGVGAADPAAVGPPAVPGADAVDEGHLIHTLQGVALLEKPVHLVE